LTTIDHGGQLVGSEVAREGVSHLTIDLAWIIRQKIQNFRTIRNENDKYSGNFD
jgi:hypothetical protein